MQWDALRPLRPFQKTPETGLEGGGERREQLSNWVSVADENGTTNAFWTPSITRTGFLINFVVLIVDHSTILYSPWRKSSQRTSLRASQTASREWPSSV